MKINCNKSLNESIGAVSSVLLLVLFSLNIINMGGDIKIQIIIYWIFGGLAIVSILAKSKVSLYVLSLVCFGIYISIVTVVNQSVNIYAFSILFGYMTLWICVIIIFSYISVDGVYDNFFRLVPVFAIVMGIYIMSNYEVHKTEGNFGFVNTNYYLLCAMPIVFLTKSKKLKRIAMIVAYLTVLLSLKRTGIISLFAMWVSLFIYYSRNANHFAIKSFVAIIIFLVLVLNYEKIVEMLGVDFLERFDTLEEDKGSGRFDIYRESLDIISNGGFLRFIFGSGYNGLIKVHGSSVSSHNDILEIIIDYGVIGLVYYLYVVVRYLKICTLNIKYRTVYAEACIVSICVFALITLFSHGIIYPSYFMFILIFWIYVDKQTFQMKNHSNIE